MSKIGKFYLLIWMSSYVIVLVVAMVLVKAPMFFLTSVSVLVSLSILMATKWAFDKRLKEWLEED